jgi:hypothetical protein
MEGTAALEYSAVTMGALMTARITRLNSWIQYSIIPNGLKPASRRPNDDIITVFYMPNITTPIKLSSLNLTVGKISIKKQKLKNSKFSKEWRGKK